MPVALKALVAALAFGPLAVHGLFEHVSFSPIEQCGPFNVSFNGGVAPDALPLRLTIIPFNASPISIVLPTESWNATSATGAAITFLPLAANTTFLASLNDANGNPTGVNTSDIIQVQPSDNSLCLSASTPAFTPLYTVSQPRQCEIFNVSYDSSIVTAPPTARVYAPLAPTFTLDNKAFQNGSSTYLMNVTRGTQVAIMFNDNAGHNQTSVPLTVFGDTSSSSACLSTLDVAPAPLGSASDTNGGLPRLAIVIIVVCTIAIVGTISLMSVIFVVRERRRRRTTRLRNAFFPRGDPEKINPYVEPAPSAPLPTYLPEPREARLLTGQPYGAVSPRSEMFGGRISTAPVTPKSPKSGMSDKSGFSQAIYALPSPPPPPTLSRPMPRNTIGRSASLASVNARTIASLDIEQMLEQATTSPGPASAAFNAPGLPSSAGHIMPSQQLSRTPTQVPSPLPSALRISPVSSKRDAQELDVPSSATPSGQFSDYSPIQAMSPESRYRVAPFLDPPPFSANSRRNQPSSPYSR